MGPHVFAKIQKVSGISADKKTSSWNDSHPLPMDRERKLMEQSKVRSEAMKPTVECNDLP